MFTWEEAGLLRQMLLVISWTVLAILVVGVGWLVLRLWF